MYDDQPTTPRIRQMRKAKADSYGLCCCGHWIEPGDSIAILAEQDIEASAHAGQTVWQDITGWGHVGCIEIEEIILLQDRER